MRHVAITGHSGESIPIPLYFEHFRKDVLAVVPPGAKSVLSVGCGAGRTEAELVKQGIAVVGVEINPQAAQMARQRGIIVLEGDATKIDVNVGFEPYDCILYADVLEHLIDPESLLRRHTDSLRAGGIAYVTVPNFRNCRVFWELFIRGHIVYRDAGILDRTHIRMTTRKMVLEWFHSAGLEFICEHYITSRRRKRLISACLLGLAREFIADQIALVAAKGPATIAGNGP
jgi:2-polyprenyl-3-methyl-5-hydroxy-6-metoxy-1,4-benzoquinol methylase